MIRFNLKFVRTSLLVCFAIGVSCFSVGISGYSHDECGSYLPAWLIVAGCSLSFFSIFYGLSVRYSGRDKQLTIVYAIIAGLFVLFNIFLILVGDYAFSRFKSECSFKSYGTGKSKYVPYTSTITMLILFNILATYGMILLVFLVYHYKKKGIHYFKRIETTKEISKNDAGAEGDYNEVPKSITDMGKNVGNEENYDEAPKPIMIMEKNVEAEENYGEMPKPIIVEKEV